MRLDDLDPSKNVRDQGRGGGNGFGGGGGGLGMLLSFLPMLLGRKLGCGTILLIGGAALAFFYFGGSGLQLADNSGTGGFQPRGAGANVACDTTSPDNPAAAQHRRPWALSIARRIRASISTPASSRKWNLGSVPRAILPRPM